jgi:hypothetical protein
LRNRLCDIVRRSNGYSISTQKLNHKKWLLGLAALYAVGYIGMLELRFIRNITSKPAQRECSGKI